MLAWAGRVTVFQQLVTTSVDECQQPIQEFPQCQGQTKLWKDYR